MLNEMLESDMKSAKSQPDLTENINSKYVNGGLNRFSISQGGKRKNALDMIKKLKENKDDNESLRSASRMLKFIYSGKGGF